MKEGQKKRGGRDGGEEKRTEGGDGEPEMKQNERREGDKKERVKQKGKRERFLDCCDAVCCTQQAQVACFEC